MTRRLGVSCQPFFQRFYQEKDPVENFPTQRRKSSPQRLQRRGEMDPRVVCNRLERQALSGCGGRWPPHPQVRDKRFSAASAPPPKISARLWAHLPSRVSGTRSAVACRQGPIRALTKGRSGQSPNPCPPRPQPRLLSRPCAAYPTALPVRGGTVPGSAERTDYSPEALLRLVLSVRSASLTRTMADIAAFRTGSAVIQGSRSGRGGDSALLLVIA